MTPLSPYLLAALRDLGPVGAEHYPRRHRQWRALVRRGLAREVLWAGVGWFYWASKAGLTVLDADEAEVAEGLAALAEMLQAQ